MHSFGAKAKLPRSTSRDTSSDLSFRMSDWMRAVTSPTPYRVGTAFTINTYRVAQCCIIMLLALTGLVLLIPVFFYRPFSQHIPARYQELPAYNSTYPLSPPTHHADGSITYRIGVVADLDTDSKLEKKDVWISKLKIGHLTVPADRHKKISLRWEHDEVRLESELSLKGRGMELSELTAFNGHLYTCDDRTGVIFEITPNYEMLPWVILGDGDGLQKKGFKCEWMAVRDHTLWVGGLGKEWTTTEGVVQNLHPQWVKSIGHVGDIQHHSWVEQFNALRAKAGCHHPGYLIHESASWSAVHEQWLFLPRRASKDTYTEQADERRATNILLRTDNSFRDISLTHIGALHLTHGFSAFRFIPGTNDRLIVALKSEEDAGKIASYILVFDINGEIVLDETKIGDHKYEGIEFI